MNLLRNNLYLVILSVVTLVVAGIFLYLGSNKSTEIEEMQTQPRLKIAQSLSRLARRPRANAGTIEGKDTRNKLAHDELNAVRTNLTRYNRRNFKVDSLKLLNGELRPVLPYASDVWRDNVLALPYIQSYHNSLTGLLRKLDAINIPTGKVIEREAKNLQTRFDRERRVEEKGAVPTGGARAVTTTQISPRAYKEPANKVKLIGARRGQMYAAKNCFDIYLTDMNKSQLTADEVWESQLNIWVQQDIVDVLVKTNEEVQKSLNIPENERCVINTAVKRLVRIEVSGRSKKDATGSVDKRAGFSPMGGPGMMPTRGRSRRTQQVTRKVERADSLTGNTADQMMDIVNYSFTVVISTRSLPVLEKKLIEQNFHFILNESIKSYPSVASVPPSSDGSYSQEQLSYYGVDPVSVVTITGQLALLTDWVRGTYDEQEKVWVSQPLMPISVMEKLSSAAQRKQDKELISKKLPRPWDPSFVPEKTGQSSRRRRR